MASTGAPPSLIHAGQLPTGNSVYIDILTIQYSTARTSRGMSLSIDKIHNSGEDLDSYFKIDSIKAQTYISPNKSFVGIESSALNYALVLGIDKDTGYFTKEAYSLCLLRYRS